MPVDPTIIAALESAISGDPDNVNLRLHLAQMLLEGGRAHDALEHAASVLNKQPAHLEALQAATRAAEATGDKERAEGYKRLYEALSWNRAKSLVEDIEESRLSDTPPPRPQQNYRNTLDREDEDEDDNAGEPQRVRMSQDGDVEDADSLFDMETPDMTLEDVAGMVEVKRRLNMAFLAPLKNPDMRRMYGKSLRGGLLMYGPPGCGKTYIARATAGEMGARFISVGINEVLDSYVGNSEKNLHAIFSKARRNSPCVLFFDELDALGRKRSLMREAWSRTYVNQLLTELDSVASNNEGIFVMAATNHPWDIDVALRRPGRLDRTLLVLPPDAPARNAIIRANLRDRPVEGVDINWVVSKTDGFSGADVAHLCDSATEFALEDSIERGIARPVGQRDFQKAIRDVRPTVRSWFDTARHYAQFANEDGVYDDLLKYLKTNNML